MSNFFFCHYAADASESFFMRERVNNNTAPETPLYHWNTVERGSKQPKNQRIKLSLMKYCFKRDVANERVSKSFSVTSKMKRDKNVETFMSRKRIVNCGVKTKSVDSA